MKTERFDPVNVPYSKAMIKDDIGGYIKYEDYEKLEAEKKDLTKALEAIKSLTSDEQSPLMKALHEIAHKTLK